MKRLAIFPVVMVFTAFVLSVDPVRVADGQGAIGFGQRFETAPLEIVIGTERHAFTVEVARTNAQRAQGLMFRRMLGPDRGMLFLYPTPQIINMWMKNTLIPLDMLFMDKGGKVVAVHERAVPESLHTISSGLKASAVLEVQGGTVERLGIRPGAHVLSPALNDR